MKSVANDIKKIRFTNSVFDVDALCTHTRYVYDLLPNGDIISSIREKGIRKPVEKKTYHLASSEDYKELCEKINECIEKADTLNQYVDDTSIEVTLYRQFGRKEIMDGGYGAEDEDLRRILYRYITGFMR